MLKAVRNLEELRQQADSAPPIADANRPLDLLRDLPAPPFADDTVPAAILNLSSTFSAATGFDRSGLMVAAVGAAGAMIDDRARLAVRPASGWFESARLWLALIGSPSAGKTPTLSPDATRGFANSCSSPHTRKAREGRVIAVCSVQFVSVGASIHFAADGASRHRPAARPSRSSTRASTRAAASISPSSNAPKPKTRPGGRGSSMQ